MRGILKFATTLVLVACATLANGVAHAIPISGSFLLADDNSAVIYGHGSFTTGSMITPDGYTEADLTTTYDTVDIEIFNIVDDPSLPVFGNYNVGNFSSIQGILETNGIIQSVIGFTGSGTNGTSSIFFFGPRALGTNPMDPRPTFFQFNTALAAGGGFASGIQVIPEPSSIALLGIGLFGVGMARRRTKS